MGQAVASNFRYELEFSLVWPRENWVRVSLLVRPKRGNDCYAGQTISCDICGKWSFRSANKATNLTQFYKQFSSQNHSTAAECVLFESYQTLYLLLVFQVQFSSFYTECHENNKTHISYLCEQAQCLSGTYRTVTEAMRWPSDQVIFIVTKKLPCVAGVNGKGPGRGAKNVRKKGKNFYSLPRPLLPSLLPGSTLSPLPPTPPS